MRSWFCLVSVMLICTALICVSCQTNRKLSVQSETVSPPFPRGMNRLSELNPEIKDQWLAYVNNEGDAHRSDEFDRLAGLIDATCFTAEGSSQGWTVHERTLPENRATELEVLSFLGLPDCGQASGEYFSYVYYYWRTDTNSRWVAIVQIKNGMLDGIGWNDATVNDFSGAQHYKNWSEILSERGLPDVAGS